MLVSRWKPETECSFCWLVLATCLGAEKLLFWCLVTCPLQLGCQKRNIELLVAVCDSTILNARFAIGTAWFGVLFRPFVQKQPKALLLTALISDQL